MPEGSLILDRTYFDKPEWRDQKNARDGFSASAAWLDVSPAAGTNGGAPCGSIFRKPNGRNA